MYGAIPAEFPHVTAGNFENALASDDIFSHFFNDFLSLPCFHQPLQYNQETGQFEVVTRAAEVVASKIKSELHHRKTLLITHDPTVLAKIPPVDNSYTACCLNRKHGIRWIMKERLPFFLQSDCYYEYRLAKLLFQWLPSDIRGTCSTDQTDPSASLKLTEDLKQPSEPPKQQPEHPPAKVVKHAPDDFVAGEGPANIRHTPEGSSREKSRLSKVVRFAENVERKETHQNVKKGSEQAKKAESEKTPPVLEKEVTNQVTVSGLRDQQPGLDNFKKFLRGTQGEKILNLWLDIERLKATEQRDRKNSFLILMKSRYLLSSSYISLNMELLARLALTTSPCWTEEQLTSIQPFLTESLLYYWIPRFWTSRHCQADYQESDHIGLPTQWFVNPTSDFQSLRGSVTLPPLRPNNWLARSPQSAPSPSTQGHTSRSPALDSAEMKKMLKALCVDTRAGLYFTHFCELSGNQLWENAVHCWTDLQHYHELFSQAGLDNYRVEREAQLLYTTYLVSPGRRSIGVSDVIREKVYDHLIRVFAEMFDEVEEHALIILLEPWNVLVNKDKTSFQQVGLHNVVRHINSDEYREILRLDNESKRHLKRVEECEFISSPSVPPLPKPQIPDTWANVPPQYHGFRLGTLLRRHKEITYFMTFLQSNDASIHLLCWRDLETYRRISQKDVEQRIETSTQITNKYLNKNYFFSADSPATKDQQNDILRLAGGAEHLKRECLINSVVVEIRDIIRAYLERIWLPLFLTTPEFTERQNVTKKPKAPDKVSFHQRKRREAWKHEGLWMSSTKEILLFRRILRNPLTCLQFRYFVSLKGHLLENDVLFWVEVQRYKEACNWDELAMQRKMSVIIDCFINCATPPSLQININTDQVDEILEKSHTMDPYLFCEAQATVFIGLLKHWPSFQELRHSVKEHQLLPLLEGKRARMKSKARRRRKKEEEEEEKRKAQEQLEREITLFMEDDEGGEEGGEDAQETETRIMRPQSRSRLGYQQSMSWSYSQHLAEKKREELLKRKQGQGGTPQSNLSVCSSQSSGRSISSRPNQAPAQPDPKRRNRYEGFPAGGSKSKGKGTQLAAKR